MSWAVFRANQGLLDFQRDHESLAVDNILLYLELLFQQKRGLSWSCVMSASPSGCWPSPLWSCARHWFTRDPSYLQIPRDRKLIHKLWSAGVNTQSCLSRWESSVLSIGCIQGFQRPASAFSTPVHTSIGTVRKHPQNSSEWTGEKILREQSGDPAIVCVWSILAFLCSKNSCTTFSKDTAVVSRSGEIWQVGIPEVHVPLHFNAYCTSEADFVLALRQTANSSPAMDLLQRTQQAYPWV